LLHFTRLQFTRWVCARTFTVGWLLPVYGWLVARVYPLLHDGCGCCTLIYVHARLRLRVGLVVRAFVVPRLVARARLRLVVVTLCLHTRSTVVTVRLVGWLRVDTFSTVVATFVAPHADPTFTLVYGYVVVIRLLSTRFWLRLSLPGCYVGFPVGLPVPGCYRLPVHGYLFTRLHGSCPVRYRLPVAHALLRARTFRSLRLYVRYGTLAVVTDLRVLAVRLRFRLRLRRFGYTLRSHTTLSHLCGWLLLPLCGFPVIYSLLIQFTVNALLPGYVTGLRCGWFTCWLFVYPHDFVTHIWIRFGLVEPRHTLRDLVTRSFTPVGCRIARYTVEYLLHVPVGFTPRWLRLIPWSVTVTVARCRLHAAPRARAHVCRAPAVGPTFTFPVGYTGYTHGCTLRWFGLRYVPTCALVTVDLRTFTCLVTH